MRKLTVACIQMRTSVDVQENIETASRLVSEAAATGARLVVTPEMTTLLDKRPGKLFEQARYESDDIALPEFQKLARTLGIDLVIGSIPIKVADNKCVGRSFLINPQGEVVAKYDKIHMFDVQLGNGQVYRESDRYQAGNKSYVVDRGDYKVGLTICYDLRFPELYRNLARAGAEIITIPSSFTTITGEAHWHVLLRARAIESGCFVLAPAQHGHHADGRETYGHSLIVDPWGRILGERAADPGVLVCELNLDDVYDVRQKVPSLQHDKQYTIETVSTKA